MKQSYSYFLSYLNLDPSLPQLVLEVMNNRIFHSFFFYFLAVTTICNIDIENALFVYYLLKAVKDSFHRTRSNNASLLLTYQILHNLL